MLERKFTESDCIGLMKHTNFHTLIVTLKCREALQNVGQLSSQTGIVHFLGAFSCVSTEILIGV